MLKKDDLKVISVECLLAKKIGIPSYQRPYKWSEKNVTQLMDDIVFHKNKAAYRLGTVVLHSAKGDPEKLEIVDGQQRFVTLQLIVHALKTNVKDQTSLPNLPELHFSNDSNISKRNIINNYHKIKELIHNFDPEVIDFFIKKCEVVQVVIDSLPEAFQFFDSQNARGKALEPHDLLKAFHLREMQSESVAEKKKTVAAWESVKTQDLADLFAVYLYRIRNWVNGASARNFSKDEIDLFKGVSLESCEYSFARAMRIAHLYVSDYNNSMHSAVHHPMPYPFQLDQTIINGKRFFEMIGHYLELFDKIKDTHNLNDEIEHYQRKLEQIRDGAHASALNRKSQPSILETWGLDDDAVKIIHALANYPGRGRTGDKYTRVLFDCCLAYYVDKFGLEDISKAIKTCFIWAYTLRLGNYRVSVPSMDNHARSNGNMFKKLKDMFDPHGFIHMPIEKLKDNINTSKTQGILELFEKFKQIPSQEGNNE